MAAAQYYEQVQQAYLAYYGRPADPQGLVYWATQLSNAGGNWNTIINAFGNSAESQSLYGSTPGAAQISAIYQQLFGHAPDAAGLNFYVNGLATGQYTLASIALNIYYGATGTDQTALNNKLVYADAFTQALQGSVQGQVNYTGNAAAANARAAVAGVTDSASEATAQANLTTTIANIGTGTVGQTYSLTTGVDTITLTGNNNVVNATNTAAAPVLGSLDVIKGTGTGNTLNIADTAAAGNFTLPIGISISGIQTDNITTNAAFGSGLAAFDLSGQAGLTTANLVAADSASTGFANVKVADTTALNLTVTAGDSAKIAGGTAVTLNNGAAADINGAGLTSVTLNKTAGAVVVNNGSATALTAAAADGKGTTLTSVTLNGVTGATASLTGKGLTNVTLQNIGQTDAITVNNTTANHTLNVTTSAVGYDSTGTALTGAAAVSVADAVATAVTLNATGATDIKLTAGLATSLTVSGSGAVVIDPTSALGTVTAINASANSGGVTLTDSAAGAVLTGGSGNDVVTLAAALTTASGGSINLGAGNNTLIVAAGGSIGAGVTVDGGVGGTNTISATLVNAGNAANIKDFQVLDVSGFGATNGNGALDASLLSSPVSGVSISSGLTAGAAKLLNLASAVTVTDTLDAAAGAPGANSALVLTHAGTATNSLAINFAETSKTSVNVETIDSVQSTGDSTISIASGGASKGVGFGNAIGSIAETDNHLTTVTITGAHAFTLGGITTAVTNAAAPASGSTASSLTTIDGSAATGALTITAGANSGAGNNIVSYAGLTIKGGIGGDTIVNHAGSGVIVEGATASTLANHLTIDGTGASINDAASAGTDVLTLSGANNSATLGSGTGVNVTISTNATLSNVDSVTFGTGTATVTDNLLYGVASGNQTAATNGDLLTLNGTLHGNTLAFGAAILNTGALGAATSVAAAQTFDQAVYLALGGTAGGAASTTTTLAANHVDWFQYAGNTYVVDSGAAAPGANAAQTASVVKIAGLVDLSHATVDVAGAGIHFA